MILIAATLLVITAAVTIGLLVFIDPSDREAEETPPTINFIIDTSKSYQACEALNERSIKSAMGEIASSIQAPKDLGIVGEQPLGIGVEGVQADTQTCLYAFNSGGNEENGFGAENAFIISKTVYTSVEAPEIIMDQLRKDPTTETLSEVSENAFFSANTPENSPNALFSFDLYVFSEESRTTLSIRQPAAIASFTTESARQALVELASQIIR